MHGDDVAGQGQIGGPLNGAERSGRRSGIGIAALEGDVDFGGGRGDRQTDDDDGKNEGFAHDHL